MDQQEFNDFFKSYSQNVDNANQHAFWKLSDAIIEKIIINNIDNHTANFTLLDAGGGTGRWIIKFSKKFPNAKFVLLDFSEDMLEKAKENIKSANLEDRVDIIHGDMTNIHQLSDQSIDYVTSIYSPLSFIENTQSAINEINRVLKNHGKTFIMGHGYYNSLYSFINNYSPKAEELTAMETQYTVKWAPFVPTLKTFSQESMESLFLNAGFKMSHTYGVPVFAQPGSEDWDPENKKRSKISEALEDEKFFQKVFELEMKFNKKREVANRGMNIFSIGIK